METCHYGCKKEAKYQLKNGKHCCSPRALNCPGVRRKSKNARRSAKKRIRDKSNWADGYRYVGDKKGNRGWYKGYWCDSSYELAFVIYNLDHKIPFERNLEKFPYVYRKRKRNWLPDFLLLETGTYVEIKGYETRKDKAKRKHFEHPLIVLKRADLNYAFEYVHKTYGKKFIELLEKEP